MLTTPLMWSSTPGAVKRSSRRARLLSSSFGTPMLESYSKHFTAEHAESQHTP